MHHLYAIRISLFPTSNKTIMYEEPKVSRTHQVASKRHLTPNFHPPWSRKMIVTGTTAHPWPTQMASTGHALMAFLLTAHRCDSYALTPPNPTSTFYARWSALVGESGLFVPQLAAVSTDHRTVRAGPRINSHIFSVVLNISPRKRAASLPTSLKLQESTKDNSQNTNISRRVLDITRPGRK